jgi:hypothetical protein
MWKALAIVLLVYLETPLVVAAEGSIYDPCDRPTIYAYWASTGPLSRSLHIVVRGGFDPVVDLAYRGEIFLRLPTHYVEQDTWSATWKVYLNAPISVTNNLVVEVRATNQEGKSSTWWPYLEVVDSPPMTSIEQDLWYRTVVDMPAPWLSMCSGTMQVTNLTLSCLTIRSGGTVSFSDVQGPSNPTYLLLNGDYVGEVHSLPSILVIPPGALAGYNRFFSQLVTVTNNGQFFVWPNFL